MLAFNGKYFGDYVDRATGKVIGIGKVKKVGILKRGINTSIVITANVVKAAREHFGCETLEGMELENEAAGTHWEQRIVGREAMNSYTALNSVVSKISASLLEDSGWYKVDLSSKNIMEFQWGKGQGCDFVGKPCLAGGKAQFHEFCEGKLEGCSNDFAFLTNCTGAAVTTNSSIDPSMDYYGNKSYHSAHSIDNCPFQAATFKPEKALCLFFDQKEH